MRLVRAVSVGITAATIACGSPTQPTNGVTPDFIFAAGMNVIAVGSSTRFTVTAYTRSSNPNAYVKGVQQMVDISASASWSSDNPAVAAVSSGNILGRGAGTTNVRASYMGRDYTIPLYVVAPSALAQQFVGTWSGVTNRFCNDLVGSTRSCYNSSGQPGVSTENVSMSLTDVSGVLQGSVDIGGGHWTHVIGPVVGGVNDSGELVIGGAPRLLGDEDPHQLRDWRFSLSGTQLTGSGTSEIAFVNVYGVVLQRVTYTAMTLQ